MRLRKAALIRSLWAIAGQILMGVAVYFILLRLLESSNQVIPALNQMRPIPLLGAAGLTLVMLLLMPFGWISALRAAGTIIPFRLGFVLYYRTSILRYLPGSIWNFPGRAILSQQKGISLDTFAKSTFFELVMLLSCAGFLGGWALAVYLENLAPFVISGAAGLTIVLVVVLPYHLLPVGLKHFLNLELVERRALISMIPTYMMVWICYGGAIALVIFSQPGIRTFDPLFIIIASTAAWTTGFLSPSPVGLGVRELGLSVMLGSALGTFAITASLAQRIMEAGLEALLWIVARILDP